MTRLRSPLVVAFALIVVACVNTDVDTGSEATVSTGEPSTSGSDDAAEASDEVGEPSATSIPAVGGYGGPTATTGDEPGVTGSPSADDLVLADTQPKLISGDDTEPDPGAPLPVIPEPKVPRTQLPMVEAARADLASRLGVDPAEIGVVLVESVVWPDGSLGCPQPGMEYIQVPMDGARIVLTHAGMTFSYHTGGARTDPFLCATPATPLPPGSGAGDS